ncbi:MAG: winged helix-turn-helix transcriptional regulator [Fibrobacter sp.]|nr:winged helix-turn-helix transcriptional regulator [Fibrobacter sp.]
MSEIVNSKIEHYVTVTKALSDSNRVRALCALRKGELCLCQIIELLGLAPSTISKHMSILKQAGLVNSRKDGRWVYYRLADKKDEIFIQDIIKLSLLGLEQDQQVVADDRQMAEINSWGLEMLCKRNKGCCEN